MYKIEIELKGRDLVLNNDITNHPFNGTNAIELHYVPLCISGIITLTTHTSFMFLGKYVFFVEYT